MYLGKDLIVFTKTKKTQSIGLLSQTFLEETGMSEVRVPLVCPQHPIRLHAHAAHAPVAPILL